jgi:hypothetical protein
MALSAPAAQPQDPGLDMDIAPQPVSGADAGQLRDYGRQVGQDWLKDTLGVDIQSMEVVWDPVTWRFVPAGSLKAQVPGPSGAPQALSPGAGTGPAAGKGISVRLVQTSDLAHLSEGVRDVPYGVEMQSAFRPLQSLSAIDTSLKIPLSPYDPWRADASMPLDLGIEADLPWWWRGLGLGNNLALHSGINSRLGFNEVESGMRTKWNPGFWGLWNLDYAWDMRYGEGSGQSSNWLKFSKEF